MNWARCTKGGLHYILKTRPPLQGYAEGKLWQVWVGERMIASGSGRSAYDAKKHAERFMDSLDDYAIAVLRAESLAPTFGNDLVKLIRDTRFGMKGDVVRVVERIGTALVVCAGKELYAARDVWLEEL